jgi:predicted nuclease of predicted toxin-antitoxin system
MKFKLDENFGSRTQRIFHENGHDVLTVFDQGLQGTSDKNLYQVCCDEKRCLITLDMDFSDVFRFPPHKSDGIVVIRVPQNPSLALLEQMINHFLKTLGNEPLKGRLWIVEIGRIRIHSSELSTDY